MNSQEFWQNHKILMHESFYPVLEKHPTFDLFVSVFKESYYNFFVLREDAGVINWSDVEKILERFQQLGFGFSFYVPEQLQANFEQDLLKHGYHLTGNHLFLGKELREPPDVATVNFEMVNDTNFETYLTIVQECFPDYENNREYSLFCLEKEREDPNTSLNILVKDRDQYAAFGSIMLSHKAGMGYMHNAATLEQFRRKGFHTITARIREKLAFDNGIKFVYANVDEGMGSHKSLEQQGYSKLGKFWIFSKLTKK